MLRATFDRELRALRAQTLALGAEVETNIIEVIKVLGERDALGAQQLIAGDLEINSTRIAIMNDALFLIATQQPMAGDMRLIASVNEIAGELERINDYVKGIARISLMIGADSIPATLDSLPIMAEITRQMLRKALSAAISEDVELAREIPKQDDEIDSLEYVEMDSELEAPPS